MLGTDRFFGGTLDEASAHLHPLKYALGLARAAEGAGASLFERTLAIGIEHGDTAIVRTDSGLVRAKFVVLGCNAYLGRLDTKMAGMIMPINNFVLATEPFSEDQARALIRDDVAVQDTLFVINYWKLTADNRLLFGGGETYSRKFPRDIRGFVRKYMLRVYPQLADARIDYAWGGTLAITLNRLPSFGRLAKNVLYAQGYSGHGVPTSTLAGKLLAEAIDGRPGRFDVIAKLPTPRFPGGMLLRWPGLVLGMSYYALRDRL
jgi:gamma-glutamylputrescine oxidase